ncbi:MAG: uroporphyrinogen decarboxylase [Deinococcales bacterium]
MTQDDPLFLRAARGEDTPHAPIWIMRQAGRYLPEYRALKARHSFWEMVRTPELAAEVTLQPITRFGLDAAILFSDIMTPLPPMGVSIDFDPGPVFERPVRTREQVEALAVPEEDDLAPFVADALRLLRASSSVPVIGFAGAPLTLAAYAVQGGGSKDFAEFRGFLRAEPAAAHALLEKLTEVTLRYLRMQVAAGAQAVQLFDSWAGLLDERNYRAFGLPYAQQVLAGLSGAGAPRIYLAVDASHLLPAIAELDVEVVSVDWRRPLSAVRRALPGKALQGNLDPAALLGPPDDLVTEAERVLHEGLGGAHVFNLGHGILRQTDPAAVARLVDVVRGFDRRTAAWRDAAPARPEGSRG